MAMGGLSIGNDNSIASNDDYNGVAGYDWSSLHIAFYFSSY